eukprot:scaffold119284_cov66-Attheya_sp.AAC.4
MSGEESTATGTLTYDSKVAATDHSLQLSDARMRTLCHRRRPDGRAIGFYETEQQRRQVFPANLIAHVG